jgi:hypothetical protein
VIRPCPNAVACPGTDDPISNYSSEAFDGLDYIGTWFFNVDPLFFTNWIALSCMGQYVSGVSQFDAFLNAMSMAVLCAYDDSNTGLPVVYTTIDPLNPTYRVTHPPPPTYRNTEQSCCTTYPDGTEQCSTIPAGYFAGRTQAEADWWAHSLACYLNRRGGGSVPTTALPDYVCFGDSYCHQLFVNNSSAIAPFLWTIVQGSVAVNLGGGWQLVVQSGTGIPAKWPDIISGSLDPNTGLLCGTIVEIGSWRFQVQAISKVTGQVFRKWITLCGVVVTPTGATPTAQFQLPQATKGIPYHAEVSVLGVIIPGDTVSLVLNGQVPQGITWYPNAGIFDGTPTQDGTFFFDITAKITRAPNQTQLISCNTKGLLHIPVGQINIFDNMTWTIFVIQTDPSNGSAIGGNIAVLLPAGPDLQVWQCDGHLFYTGPSITCHYSISGTPPGFVGGINNLEQDGNPITTTFNPVTNQHDFPINAGTNSLIFIRAAMDNGAYTPPPGTTSMLISITSI